MIQKLLAILTLLSAMAIPSHAKTEFGKLQGAEYRIDVPANWNHGLVVYCHGYDQHPGGVSYDERMPFPPELAVVVNDAYALNQWGTYAGAWARRPAAATLHSPA